MVSRHDRVAQLLADERAGQWPEGDGYLYHFTRFETLPWLLGRDGRLRLRPSKFSDMNDPWEAANRSMDRTTRRTNELLEQRSPPWRVMPEHIREGRLAPYRRGRQARQLRKTAPRRLAYLREARREWATVCLSQDGPRGKAWAHDAMWSHYAGRASGICLVFHRARLLEQAHAAVDAASPMHSRGSAWRALVPVPRLVAGDVAYIPSHSLAQSRRNALEALLALDLQHAQSFSDTFLAFKYDESMPSVLAAKIEQRYREHDRACAALLRSLCATKATGWEYEREFRLIMYSRDVNGLSAAPPDAEIAAGSALAAVVVGPASSAQRAAFWLERLLLDSSVRVVWRYEGNAELYPVGALDGAELVLRI